MDHMSLVSSGFSLLALIMSFALLRRFFFDRSNDGTGYDQGRCIVHVCVALVAIAAMHIANTMGSTTSLFEWLVLLGFTMSFIGSAAVVFFSPISAQKDGLRISRLRGMLEIRWPDVSEIRVQKGSELPEQEADRVELTLGNGTTLIASGWSNLKSLIPIAAAHAIPINGDLPRFAVRRNRLHGAAITLTTAAAIGINVYALRSIL